MFFLSMSNSSILYHGFLIVCMNNYFNLVYIYVRNNIWVIRVKTVKLRPTFTPDVNKIIKIKSREALGYDGVSINSKKL